MIVLEHAIYMTRCLQLARLGEGHTAPNPMVGSVIVHQGKIIGEGFHQQYGGPHAEVNAIRSVKDENLLAESTIYVSLEPCSHHGKTPPCADMIIQKGIPKVVIGSLDPNPMVSGSGIKKLQNAGCEVEVGILNEKCRELNRRFFTFHEKQRPYIILKWAQTLDGFVDTKRSDKNLGAPNWITDEMARMAVHKQRSTENAILIGTTTALHDNPSLTLRDWHGRQPYRMVFDMNHRLPSNLNIFNGLINTITCSKSAYKESRKTDYLILESEDLIDSLLHSLYDMKIQSVIIEGGTTTLNHFIKSSRWDEAHVYTGNTVFNEGIKAPKLMSAILYRENFKNSHLAVYRNI
jgi:diaminohydroxyphosphoribosylaminopyrimidine deaminase/5-amino-6-(5-phosphoribosylamino)uracil reductase